MNDLQKKAAAALELIKQSNSVLLHCHPSPDPDSVGSVLALKFVLEKIGKKVAVIRGDSVIPEAFLHLPGATDIIPKNFFEINKKDFDLFIVADSASPEQISRFKPLIFPLEIKTLVIDHHKTNIGYGDLNIVEPSYPASAELIYDLLTFWQMPLDNNIATNLFIGIYTDTGGFKYEGVSTRTFEIAAKLFAHTKDLSKQISKLENSYSPNHIYMEGLAFSSIQTYFEGKLALSVVSAKAFSERSIAVGDIRAGEASTIMNMVKDWQVVGAIFEYEEGKIRISFRTHHSDKFDVSELAKTMGGGGHKAAAGAVLNMSLDEAKNLVVSKAKELYNF